MKIYTGYYAQVKTYKAEGLTPVAISLGMPPWVPSMTNCRSLNPLKHMLKMEREPYTLLYNSILAGLDCKELVSKLETISSGRDVVLLCFEKPSDFCHRQLVAEWLTKNGYPTAEFEISYVPKFEPKKPAKKKTEQMELF